MTYNINTKKLHNLIPDSEKRSYQEKFSKDEYDRIAWSSFSKNSISKDRNYLFVMSNRNDIYNVATGLKEIYMLDIKNSKWIEVKQPETKGSLYGAEFVENDLQLTYFIMQDEYHIYYYDIKSKIAVRYTPPAELTGFIKDEFYSNIYTKANVKDGSLTVKNIENNKQYSLKIEPSTLIYGSPNNTGEYIIGGYQKVKITGEDEKGTIYENPTTPYKKAIFNMNTGKIITLDDFENSTNNGLSYETYKGKPITATSWVSENKIMLTYSENKLTTKLTDDMLNTEILDIKEFKELP